MATFDINKYIREQGSQEPVGSIMSPDTAEPSDKITDFYKRFSQSIYNAFEDKERFNQTFGPKAIPKQNVDWDEVRRYTRDADMRDAIEGSISEALGILQEPTPEPQGVTLVDVTDTEEGKLSNPEPLYEMAKEIDPGTIETTEIPASGEGIMSRQRHRDVELDEIPTNIDSAFLGQQEGAAKTTAYVPKDKAGKALDSSGVTIGTGVDLGSKDKNYFRYLDDADLVAKLEPYFGKKKDAAISALNKTPLTLTAEEVKKLDTYVKKLEFRTLKNKWNSSSDVKWEDLPSGKATAVASVYYQYGPAMFKHNFWTQTTTGLWDAAYNNLMNYGDKYPSRRKREAAILKKDL